MQVRNQFFQISDKQGKAFCFRAQREQLLLEIQIEGQGSGKIKGQRRRVSAGDILLRSRDRQQFCVQLNRAVRVFLRRRAGFIVDHHNFRLQEGTLLIYSQKLETPAPFRNEVEAPVGVFFDDGNDFGGAAHFGQTLLHRADHAEQAILRQALANHLFIARFEDMQRQGRAGEQYDIQREQGNEGGQAVSVSAGIRARMSRLTLIVPQRLTSSVAEE